MPKKQAKPMKKVEEEVQIPVEVVPDCKHQNLIEANSLTVCATCGQTV